MLFKKHTTVQDTPGYHELIEGEAEHLHLLRFGLLNLTAEYPSVTRNSGNEEIGLVILTGRVTVHVGNQEFAHLGGRESVFTAPATTVYVPIHTEYTVTVESEVASVAVCRSAASKSYEPFVVQPDDVLVALRGQNNWRREVRDIMTGNVEGRVDRLVIGETINYPGEWSGYPPHRHEEDRPPEELSFEEIYYFKVEPKDGFGIQVHYGSKYHEDAGYVIQDGDAFAIPDGFHPVVAAGGYRVYYLWFMAGPSGRTLTPFEDPKHRWVKDLK
ncbi:MAG: 5-deoxy-glucuronate isomerase [Thermoflavifilum sp.]|nr:5-deoxy-glucuronate isomerase [Thermoflavifilum sp.]MCL6514589.1 5-deoxy-glucuronate isomerase [Alicyclobacillus sp.]